jgi:hypothetical protein
VRLGSPAKGHRRRACARRRISRGLLLLLRSTIVGTILAARTPRQGWTALGVNVNTTDATTSV